MRAVIDGGRARRKAGSEHLSRKMGRGRAGGGGGGYVCHALGRDRSPRQFQTRRAEARRVPLLLLLIFFLLFCLYCKSNDLSLRFPLPRLLTREERGRHNNHPSVVNLASSYYSKPVFDDADYLPSLALAASIPLVPRRRPVRRAAMRPALAPGGLLRRTVEA